MCRASYKEGTQKALALPHNHGSEKRPLRQIAYEKILAENS